jgi:hypothetical protein
MAINNINNINAAIASNNGESDKSWFEAMAEAWGKALDTQASKIETISNEIDQGNNMPSKITELAAEAQLMSLLSNSSHNSISSVGSALDTMARKQ